MLTIPFLAKCGDRHSMPKSHPTSGSPEDWFSNDLLKKNNLTGISFDFFVNWHLYPPSITPIIWIKRILSPAFNYQQAIVNIENILVVEFGLKQLQILQTFATNHRLKIQFIIFNDEMTWKDSASEILVVDFKSKENERIFFSPSLINIGDFKSTIRNHSGGPVHIGAKGLTYGTSNLECYLSGTDSLYPGDVDLIILDEKCKPFCILEFKKHTIDTSISFQQLSNYYPKPDERKYKRLAILQDYLSHKNNTIPILILYYPTNALTTEGRLELLNSTSGKLFTDKASNFLLPVQDATGDALIQKIKKAVAYHHLK